MTILKRLFDIFLNFRKKANAHTNFKLEGFLQAVLLTNASKSWPKYVQKNMANFLRYICSLQFFYLQNLSVLVLCLLVCCLFVCLFACLFVYLLPDNGRYPSD